MFRFAIVAIMSMCSIASVMSENADVCQDRLEEYTICLLHAPDSKFNTDDYAVDDAACIECFTRNNFFEQYDATNCDDATNEICTFFNMCLQECFPKSTLCSEEVTAFYTCEFGKVYAPESCMVTCDGFGGVNNGSDDSTISSGNGEGNDGGVTGGDKNADDKKDSTSAGSATSSMVALSVSASTLLVVAGLLL
jgi:hypothetical protein